MNGRVGHPTSERDPTAHPLFRVWSACTRHGIERALRVRGGGGGSFWGGGGGVGPASPPPSGAEMLEA